MLQHFLRHIQDENWLLFLKRLRHRASAQDFGSSLDRGRIRFSIELKNMQSLFVAI
jgi:hypothetical protein